MTVVLMTMTAHPDPSYDRRMIQDLVAAAPDNESRSMRPGCAERSGRLLATLRAPLA